MLKEYIIYYENTWMRFFINRFGLCVSKMEHNRFSGFEILLSDAKDDFCAAHGGELISLVCQTKDGDILYLTYDGSVWEKTILLKGKEKKSYNKYFTLVPIGKFMNLFYVINHEGKSMLIHHILDGAAVSPEVVDYINPSGIRFFAAPHISSDISLSYTNLNGICGTKIYRWSQKSFLHFVPLTKESGLLPPFAYITAADTYIAAPRAKEAGASLMFYLKKDNGELKEVMLSKHCSENADPVILQLGEKLCIQWRDKGSIISAFSDDGGRSFSKPIKYMKNASAENTLYVIDNGKTVTHCYGSSSGSTITFYSAPELLLTLKNTQKRQAEIITEGYDAEEFAKNAGYKKASGWEEDPYVTQKELKAELEMLFKTMDEYNKVIKELNEKIEKLS